MKKLASVLLVLALVSATQAGIILSEDFEGGTVGNPVAGWNGWSGDSNVLISDNVIDSGKSAAWGSGSPDWPGVYKGFSYSPGAGEQYVLTAVLNAPASTSDYGHLTIRNSDGSVHIHAMLGYGELIFQSNSEGNQVRVTQASTMDVRLVLDGAEVDCFYRTHGATEWSSAGSLSSSALSNFNYVVVIGHAGYAGGVDSVVLEAVPEPATMGLLAMGGLGVLIRRKS
jgi:hypothetical protein